MTRARTSVAACLVALALTGCATGESSPRPTLPPLAAPRTQPALRGVSLQESAAPVPGMAPLDGHPTMLWLLTASGVLDEIGDRPVTVFAPTEAAFRNFAVLDRDGVMNDPLTAAPLLRRLVVLGMYDAASLVGAGTVTNLAGERLTVWPNGRQVMVNEATLSPPAADPPVGATMVVYSADRLLLLAAGTG